MLNRQLTEWGIEPVIGYIVGLFAFIGISMKLFEKTQFAEYIYIVLTLSLVIKLKLPPILSSSISKAHSIFWAIESIKMKSSFFSHLTLLSLQIISLAFSKSKLQFHLTFFATPKPILFIPIFNSLNPPIFEFFYFYMNKDKLICFLRRNLLYKRRMRSLPYLYQESNYELFVYVFH